jgi:peptidase E
MTTTYLLHGGETSRDTPDNELFFRHFSDLVEKDTVDILMCYFSKEEGTWDALFNRDKAKIQKLTTKETQLSLAKDPEDLLKKLDYHDVLYVAGGQAELIEPLFSQLSGLKDKLNGKIYIGSSMGAFLASDHYVLSFENQENRHAHRGLGLLPINTLCHWDIEKEKDFKVGLLKQTYSETPILTLNECKFSQLIN